MITSTTHLRSIERMPVTKRDGYDHRSVGGGIHGDEYTYGVRGLFPNGKHVAITLTVFTQRYPSTVEPSHSGWWKPVSGADISFHIELGPNEIQPYGCTNEKCKAIGDRRCWSDGSALQADEIYAQWGRQGSEADLSEQDDSFYDAIIDRLHTWTQRLAVDPADGADHGDEDQAKGVA